MIWGKYFLQLHIIAAELNEHTRYFQEVHVFRNTPESYGLQALNIVDGMTAR